MIMTLPNSPDSRGGGLSPPLREMLDSRLDLRQALYVSGRLGDA